MEKRTQAVIELAKQGLAYSKIGEMVGLSRQRVSQICLANNIVRRPETVNPNLWEEKWQKNNHNNIDAI